ncbi:MAG: thymidine phosphorylase [Clostridia bacterium]|nr:thymidine phosphorylase [Clostridia bacterium]
MLMTDIIAKKRDGTQLSDDEIQFVVKGATKKEIPDYQLSAFLMAVYLRGMTEKETVWLTLAMAQSGEVLDLSPLGDKTVDKHSTGGVGDKTTLICAPIAAALGCVVAKMSGRGLGHTGGTVDKLESISGYQTKLSKEEFFALAKENGICLMGHSGNFAPADSILYALRDVTATVESIPLIASSIMSKKIAAGAKNIVLDVKYGSGAFMKTPELAEKLAIEMVKIGKNAGRNTTAVITDMDIPLGKSIGNALEVKEACEILKGKGDKRLRELCLCLAANMHSLSFGTEYEASYNMATKVLENGKAFDVFLRAVKSHGGDTSLITGQKDFIKSEASLKIYSKESGYISEINSEIIGKAAVLSGAGRETLEEKIDFSAGIVLEKNYGEYVNKGDLLATLYSKKERAEKGAKLLIKAFTFSQEKPVEKPLIYKIIS